MATTTISAVRQLVAARIAALSGWTQAKRVLDPRSDADTFADYAFTVSVTQGVAGGRRNRAQEVFETLSVRVRFLRRIKRDQIASMDSALDSIGDVVSAVLADDPDDIELSLDGWRQLEGLPADWLMYDANFTATHDLSVA